MSSLKLFDQHHNDQHHDGQHQHDDHDDHDADDLAAKCRGVQPCAARALTLAPASKRANTTLIALVMMLPALP